MLAFLLLFVSPGSAQTIFAVKGGPGYADMVSLKKAADRTGGRLSWQAGFLAKKQLNQLLGLQAEFLYLSRGQEALYQHALGIPLLVYFCPFDLLELEAGLLPSYSFSASDKNNNNIGNITNNELDVALVAGTRYFISNRLGMNTRLGWGLIKEQQTAGYSSENKRVNQPKTASLHHLSIMLSLEYYL